MTSPRSPDPDNLLAAIVQAVENPVALVQLLFNCRDRDSALAALQREYGWDEIQARMVMNMQFRRVVEEDRQLIRRQLEGDD
jgi:DNA gyrase/topoisomerase IV subunit A